METLASKPSPTNHTFLKEPIDAHGNTLLHIAIFHQDYALAAMLLLKGADPNLRNVSGYSALSAAKALENENLIQLLKQHGGILQDYNAETLKEASAMNLKSAVEDPNNSGSKFPSHNTLNTLNKRFSKKEPLDHKRKTHIARVPKSDFAKRFPLSQMTANELSYLGLSDLFQQLLQKSSLRLQKGDEMGLTPLMKAAFQGHSTIVNQLLSLQEIDLWALDNNHMNALMWATLGGHIGVIEIMLDLPITKEKLEHVSLHGLNLLMFASFMGNHIIVRLILEKGANVNTTTIGSLSSIQLAAWALRWEAVEVLLKYGAIVPESSDWLINGLYHLYTQQPMGVSLEHKKETLKQTLSDTQFNHFLRIEMMVQAKSEEKSTSSAGLSVAKLHVDCDSKFSLVQRLKNTLGLEKHLGYQEIYLFIELVLKVKSEGTELDAIYVKLLDATIQLLSAVQKNTKEAYMAISAKMVHHASELIRILETKLPSILASSPTAPSEDLYGFLNQPIHLLLRQKSKALTTDLAKQLMMHSRIALGVWPPPKANLDMLKRALYLVKECIEIVDLAKCIGAFRLVHQNLTVDLEISQETNRASEEVSSLHLKGLTYNDYKRQNQLKVISEISRQAQAMTQIEDNSVKQSIIVRFNTTLDSLVCNFVVAVEELRKFYRDHLREEYVAGGSAVLARVERIIEEVRQYDIFTDLNPEEGVITETDMKLVERHKISLPVDKARLPIPFLPLLTELENLLRNKAKKVLYYANLASNWWVPESTADEMMAETVPTCLNLKMYIALVKVLAEKMDSNASESRKARESWRKECLKSEQVKNMFMLWEEQLKEEESEGDENLESKILDEGDDGLIVEANPIPNKPPVVKGGQLNKIVERITSATILDLELGYAIILTHHSFTTSVELMEALIKRYEIMPPYGLSEKAFEMFVKRKIVPIRLRTCNLIRHWIENYYFEDFLTNEILVRTTLEFVEKKIAFDFERQADIIRGLLREKADDRMESMAKITEEFSIPPFLKLAYGTLEPNTFAQHLTLYDSTIFRAVTPHECLDQIWGEKRKKERLALNLRIPETPEETGIALMIKHTNRLTMWIATNILQYDTVKDRVAAIRYFVQLAIQCKELKNFNGITSIVAGLSLAPINRLHETWQMFNDKNSKLAEEYEAIAEMISPRSQYANYRKALKEVQKPAVPFLGVYLTDLTFIELGNPDYLPETHYINIEKRRKVHGVIRDIQDYQLQKYDLNLAPLEVPADAEFKILTEDQLYERSLLVEPPTEEDE